MGLYTLGTEVTLFYTFTVEGVPTDPTTVTFTVELPDETVETFVDGVDPEVTNPSTGYYELAYLPAQVGTYNYKVAGTGLVVATSPTGAFTVLADAITTERTGGPCEPWITADDVAACCASATEVSSSIVYDDVAEEASALLYELSGRLFSGQCEKTVRPHCQEGCWCGSQILSRGHIISNGNGACSGPVSCNPSRIKLSGYPVVAITEVKIDGSVVASSEYGLWKKRYLVRKNNTRWPFSQNLTLDDTEDSTFSVTYIYGRNPPSLAQSAAAQLACELYKECTTGNCALPKGTTRISRQGIVIERLAFTTWGFAEGVWRTGMPMVDAFLGAYNPSNIPRRPSVWSPNSQARYAQEEIL